MDLTQILLIGGGIISGLLLITLGVLFFVSRKTQKVMQSLLLIMTKPERAKIADATRVLSIILADEINKIEQSFQTMRDTLNAQIESANELKNTLMCKRTKEPYIGMYNLVGGKIENINSVFGVKVYSNNEKPTNGEFIALVADKMLIEGA